MKWNVATKISAGFGLTLAVFVMVGAVSYRTTTQLIETSDWVEHSHEVLNQLSEVELRAADMQNSARGYAITEDENYLVRYQPSLEKIYTSFQQARKLTENNPRAQQRLDTIEPLVKNRTDYVREVVDATRSKGGAAGMTLIKTGKGKALTDDIRKVVDEMAREEKDLLKQRSEFARNAAVDAKWTIVLGTFIALVLAALAGFFITRNIAQPLQRLSAVAERITLGDLSANVHSDMRSDEVGALARTFARMSETLREQIRSLSEGANTLGSAASEIVASTSQLAASASQSAAAVSETTSTVEEVRQTAQVSSQKAKLVSDSAQKAAQSALSGRKSTEDVAAGMSRIRQHMEAIAASMGRLSEQSQAIGRIMASVEDLAAQSNLLAVNAAIEAAKAGEHGKGFAVVALEVKSLAAQSRQATHQVRTMLADIQKATTAAVLATEQGSKAVEAGSRQSELAGESIQALAGSASEAAQAAIQIAASSQQQLVGVDQVAGAMESIKQASMQNMVSAKQLELAARNLNDLGQQFKQMVERYKVV